MLAISIMIEGQQGLTWPRWQRLASSVDELGFAGLFRSDHFTDPRPPDRDALEMVVSQAYLAAETKRIHFGPLVAPVSFRDPIQLTREALAINSWSGGRMILGLGAGWQEREHTMFGYDLGDIPTRVARFEEALEVVSRLLRSEEPVTFEGRFYHLREARLLPSPASEPRLPLLIGGNGRRRTLPLTARYADIWNGVMVDPDRFRELNEELDGLLRAEGREPNSVRRTVMNAITGTPDAVIEQLRAYEAAGAEEIMLQWLDMDDIEGLRALSQTVLPAFKS